MTIGTLVSSALVALFSVAGIQAVEQGQQSVGVNVKEVKTEQLAGCGCNKRKRCNHSQVNKDGEDELLVRCGCDKRKRCNHTRVKDAEAEKLAECGCNKRKRSDHSQTVCAAVSVNVVC